MSATTLQVSSMQEMKIDNHHSLRNESTKTSLKGVESVRRCMEEMNDQLVRLVQHHQFDFEKVSISFQKFVQFLKTLYVRELEHVDSSIFNADICRARYALLDWNQWSFVTPPASVSFEKPSLKAPAQSPNHKFKENKKKQVEKVRIKYAQMHKEVNNTLPSIDDQDSDEENIFFSNLPPATEFEKQLFSKDVDFWGVEGNNNSASSTITLPKQIGDDNKEDLDVDELEDQWFEVGKHIASRSSPKKVPKGSPTSMELGIYKKLYEHELQVKETILEHSTQLEKSHSPEKHKSTVEDKRLRSRLSRMKVVEHDSD
ncbi:hypothetical protein C9374_004827 [Naegleria lovaniensis]|uniref:Uncharacterized protein n=1 Tax=Naegleria lovaniensis TaxID=51637 RepID=A0AA88GRQ0_NAELO|nr:uncharacterized protein C9374_004827 [Naegleria lovaniensis]KAG2382860.1 hypothetical protein C9374_004827 [Naegleria lovaniensis]